MSTSPEGYETFTLVWCERAIAVSYRANWLNSGYWYLELRCAECLPVTKTGYRSHFVPQEALSDEDDILTFVRNWLDKAAQDPAWLRDLQDSRQFRLF